MAKLGPQSRWTVHIVCGIILTVKLSANMPWKTAINLPCILKPSQMTCQRLGQCLQIDLEMHWRGLTSLLRPMKRPLMPGTILNNWFAKMKHAMTICIR